MLADFKMKHLTVLLCTGLRGRSMWGVRGCADGTTQLNDCCSEKVQVNDEKLRVCVRGELNESVYCARARIFFRDDSAQFGFAYKRGERSNERNGICCIYIMMLYVSGSSLGGALNLYVMIAM